MDGTVTKHAKRWCHLARMYANPSAEPWHFTTTDADLNHQRRVFNGNLRQIVPLHSENVRKCPTASVKGTSRGCKRSANTAPYIISQPRAAQYHSEEPFVLNKSFIKRHKVAETTNPLNFGYENRPLHNIENFCIAVVPWRTKFYINAKDQLQANNDSPLFIVVKNSTETTSRLFQNNCMRFQDAYKTQC